MEQMCLVIREKGMTGILERKLEAADAQIERCKKRSDSLQKQVGSLNIFKSLLKTKSSFCTANRFRASGSSLCPATQRPSTTHPTYQIDSLCWPADQRQQPDCHRPRRQ